MRQGRAIVTRVPTTTTTTKTTEQSEREKKNNRNRNQVTDTKRRRCLNIDVVSLVFCFLIETRHGRLFQREKKMVPGHLIHLDCDVIK